MIDRLLQNEHIWRRFTFVFFSVAASLALALYALVLILDPYGLHAGRGSQTPIMDLNQRFMYPQIVRSGRYDSAVFGTSTIRLLNPERLSGAFPGRFANLGLNAGTPWEQMQLADLFLRYVPEPKTLILGIDATWCDDDADQKKLTFRTFPPWLYDQDRTNDYPELLNLKSLEIAGRVLLNRLGFMPERIRADGYEVFVPPEAQYDLARARLHIWGGVPSPLALDEIAPRQSTLPGMAAGFKFPALQWLDEFLARVPSSTGVTLATMPIHVVRQPVAGTETALRDAACKVALADIGRRYGAAVVDFRIPSPVTRDDANYWDPLHYRVGIADRIVIALHEAVVLGRQAPDGFYRILTPPQR